MIARMYQLNAQLNDAQQKKVAAYKGQCKVVYEIMRNIDRPLLATHINERVVESGRLHTKQDTLRVTLYYIIVMKGAGIVTAHESVQCEETSQLTLPLE